MPVRTMCVPQTSSDTPASRLSSVCIGSGYAAGVDLGERRVEDVERRVEIGLAR